MPVPGLNPEYLGVEPPTPGVLDGRVEPGHDAGRKSACRPTPLIREGLRGAILGDVMPGPDPGIQWPTPGVRMAGSGPAMTRGGKARAGRRR